VTLFPPSALSQHSNKRESDAGHPKRPACRLRCRSSHEPDDIVIDSGKANQLTEAVDPVNSSANGARRIEARKNSVHVRVAMLHAIAIKVETNNLARLTNPERLRKRGTKRVDS
jgi:hypothetical protein